MLENLVIPGIKNSLGVPPATTTDRDYLVARANKPNRIISNQSLQQASVRLKQLEDLRRMGVKKQPSPITGSITNASPGITLSNSNSNSNSGTISTLASGSSAAGTTYQPYPQYQTVVMPGVNGPAGATGPVGIMEPDLITYIQPARDFQEVVEMLQQGFYSQMVFFVASEKKFFRHVITDSTDLLHKIVNQEPFILQEVEILQTKKALAVEDWLMHYSRIMMCYVAEPKAKLEARNKQGSVENTAKAKELLDSFNENLKL